MSDQPTAALEGELGGVGVDIKPPRRTDLNPVVPRDRKGHFLQNNAWAFRPGGPGGPGRQLGSRNKVTADFLEALSADFSKHGVRAIQRMRNAKPHLYVQVLASLLPKQLQIEEKPLDELGDFDLSAFISAAHAALRAREDAGDGEEPEVIDQPAGLLPPVPETT